jgi:hypothetical protein
VLPVGVGPNDTTALPNGDTTNPDYFRLRRARLKFEVSPSEYVHLTIEFEPLLKGGNTPGTGSAARTLEVVGVVPLGSGRKLEIAVGQFNLPFGVEVLEPNAERPFIDSSAASGALFPGDFDMGARATLSWDKLTVMTSVVNGLMLGERGGARLPDPNRAKDVTLRAVYDFGPAEIGANGYVGTGLRIDAERLRAKNYRRWAASLESTFHAELLPKIGRTKAVAAVTCATNMDRGTTQAFALPDIPPDIGADVVDKREGAIFARVEQDVTRWVTLGARYDAYAPDLSLSANLRHTVSGVFVWHFTPKLQTMLEVDHARDDAHAPGRRSATAVTTALSAVVQARL